MSGVNQLKPGMMRDQRSCDKISSICLPDQRLKLPEGHKCYAAGWGATAPDSRPLAIPSALMQFFTSILPPTKQCGLGQSSSNRRCKSAKQPLKLLEVELPLVSLQQCRRSFPNLRDWVHVCAGARGKVFIIYLFISNGRRFDSYH
ncbi:unnamed protein product [Rodentolepis nana]|uniref:Peptidase S1 domain-containing protein n=1 Tax=Rodentolepis nana TaxID=102285 RepID=A0A0R3THB9_RODNA|nr:unnamed protein product [Rodentolepis nana]